MIKTWQEREFEAQGYVAVSPASNTRHMQAEIDELRAALQKRDAEIEQWKVKEVDWTTAYQSAYREATEATVRGFQLDGKLAAQRKVLEQALEALDLSWPMRGRYISTTEFEADCAKHQAAITAIQEQLK